MDIALLARRADAPRKVELDNLREGDLRRRVERQVSHLARDVSELCIVSAVFFALRKRWRNLRRQASET